MTEALKKTCRTPTQGRRGTTRIPLWKYQCVRRAILEVLEQSPDGQVQFKNLAELAQARLDDDELSKLGSVKWHVTTVKLNMEVEDELTRVPNLKPQTLRKVD